MLLHQRLEVLHIGPSEQVSGFELVDGEHGLPLQGILIETIGVIPTIMEDLATEPFIQQVAEVDPVSGQEG